MLLSLSIPVFSQPLESAVRIQDGRMFLVDEGRVVEISDQGRVGSALKSSSVSRLYSGGESWSHSFLALTPEGVVRLTASEGLAPKLIMASEEPQIKAWGSRFLAYKKAGPELIIVSAEAEQKISLEGKLEELWILTDSVLVQTSQGIWLLSDDPTPVLKPLKLPFAGKEAKVSEGAGKLVVWSAKSRDLVEFPGEKARQARVAPDIGVRVLEDGSILAASLHSMTFFVGELGVREYIPPAGITTATFAEWNILSTGQILDIIQMKEGRPQALHYTSRGIPTDSLPEGKIREIVEPSDGVPLLFLETSLEEEMIDADGEKVLDLTTSEPRQRIVTGHRIFRLDPEQRRWIAVVSEPRAVLVGPIEQVGSRVVYATQTEPPYALGLKQDIDREFPYPAVILHGRSLANPEEVWNYEKPRGGTPAKGRLPEESWPVLEETGDLLVTSENDALLAINASTGELRWSSSSLPLDDSSPLMLSWKDGLALVATENSSRRLLMLNPKDGSIVNSSALNDTFFWDRWRHLLGVLVICAALAYYIYVAGKRELYIRKIAGLQALDEAVGRATEMGKPVLYVVGLADVDDVQTLASLSILSHVARKTAEYDTPLITTTARAVTFSAAQEIVRDAFSIAGRPDAFSVESVRYISDDQFGYTAGVDGIMVREEPAANFYIGNFFAESLILAETGHATGSIQIAGTSQPNQLPFFVAACDYTLIGEELFAASAYLSRDPLQVGSLRGQDVGKMIVMVILVVCSLLVTFGIDWETINTATGLKLP